MKSLTRRLAKQDRIEAGDIVVAIGDRQHLDELGRLASREPRPGQAGTMESGV